MTPAFQAQIAEARKDTPMHPTPYLLSIEPWHGAPFIYGAHLGSDRDIARRCAEEIFAKRKWFPQQGEIAIRTVALMDAKRNILDVFDGDWHCDIAFADDE